MSSYTDLLCAVWRSRESKGKRGKMWKNEKEEKKKFHAKPSTSKTANREWENCCYSSEKLLSLNVSQLFNIIQKTCRFFTILSHFLTSLVSACCSLIIIFCYHCSSQNNNHCFVCLILWSFVAQALLVSLLPFYAEWSSSAVNLNILNLTEHPSPSPHLIYTLYAAALWCAMAPAQSNSFSALPSSSCVYLDIYFNLMTLHWPFGESNKHTLHIWSSIMNYRIIKNVLYCFSFQKKVFNSFLIVVVEMAFFPLLMLGLEQTQQWLELE